MVKFPIPKWWEDRKPRDGRGRLKLPVEKWASSISQTVTCKLGDNVHFK